MKQFINKAKRFNRWRRERGLWTTAGVAVSTLAGMAWYKFWDVWHGVETSKEVAFRELDYQIDVYGPNREQYLYPGWNGDYTPSSDKFAERLRSLNLDWKRFVYVDLGSGKGKTLLMAAELPFRKVIGIELSQTLADVARRNLRDARNFNRQCKDIEVIWGDATAFEYPEGPLVLYTLNSFPAPIMQRVLENLRQSLEENPRETYFIVTAITPPVAKQFADYSYFDLIDSSSGHKTYRADLKALGRLVTTPMPSTHSPTDTSAQTPPSQPPGNRDSSF